MNIREAVKTEVRTQTFGWCYYVEQFIRRWIKVLFNLFLSEYMYFFSFCLISIQYLCADTKSILEAISKSVLIKDCRWSFSQTPEGTDIVCFNAYQLQVQKLELMSSSNKAALLLLMLTSLKENRKNVF